MYDLESMTFSTVTSQQVLNNNKMPSVKERLFINLNVSNDTYAPDLDLWPSDPKINRGHLLVMINLHAKYEDSVINDI